MTHGELLLFGERIRSRRNSAGLTQEQVANEIGISLRFYQMIERGEKGMALDTLIRLSQTIHCSIDDLLFGTLPSHFNHPVIEIFEQLSSRQREDAIKILRLYLNACQAMPKEK